jgi:Bifunctional DNA primase/polymerase, N-terminal
MTKNNSLDIALDFMERGWKPVPVPYREKKPTGNGWQKQKITPANADKYFNNPRMNIGVQLGRESGGLTDIDLDCPEAIALADLMLPPTRAVFGRQSKPRSHRLYVTDLCKTESKAAIRYSEPEALARDTKERTTLVELRIGAADKGAQTVAPGSIHPSGEPIRWDDDGDPATVDGSHLKNWVATLATAALLVRHYPAEGSRHEAALVLGGVLARVPEIEAGDIKSFVYDVARAAGDDEAEERGRSAAGALDLFKRGEPTPGMPRMDEVWGSALADTVAKWLNIQRGSEDAPIATDRGLPTIRIVEGDLANAVDQAQAALIAAHVPIFVRAGLLVEPVTRERQAHYRQTKVTLFAPLSKHKLAYLLNKYAARFEHYDKRRRAWVEIDPPSKVTESLLDLRSWQFPEVVGVVSAPTMRPDGSILCAPGYDPATRLWCNADIVLPTIPERPSREQAEDALDLLKHLLSGFPFVTDVDRSVALAGLMTPVLRGAFDLTLLLAIFAHASGTGKSYLVDLIANIVTGRDCPVITISKSTEEMEKRLGSILLEGSSLTSLDNVSCDLTGDLLGQISTQTIIKIRILGENKTPECEWRGTLFATGNNIQVIGDQVRRTLVCNLDARMENPEQREFEFDPITRVHADRDAYIAAVITIARAYAAAGYRVKDLPPLVGFDGWSEVVREPLVWLGEADPVKSMEAARMTDPERAAAFELIERWDQCIGIDECVTANQIIKIANEEKDAAGRKRYPNFRALLVEQAGTTKGGRH